ncbi:MAG: site-specific integrase [Eubacteriales bacterium]|nr:site-specific integrase [Eubacteriales bacterium]
MKLIEFLDDWLENHHKGNVKHQTYVRYRSNIRNYIEQSSLSEMELDTITRKDVQAFVNDLRKTVSLRTGRLLSPGTVNNTYVTLQCAYNYAVDLELIEKNPCIRIRRAPKSYHTEIKCFTVQEQKAIERFIDLSDNPEYYCYILCLYTGLRIGELCALTWDDVDFERELLFVNKTVYNSCDASGRWILMTDAPKSMTSYRSIPLPDHILNGLRRLKILVDGNYVCSYRDGSQMAPWACRWRYDEMLKRLGIRHVSFHALRHTFATRAIENGMDIKTLSEILGHANPSVTLSIYAHSLMEHKRAMMKMMTRLL